MYEPMDLTIGLDISNLDVEDFLGVAIVCAISILSIALWSLAVWTCARPRGKHS